MNFAVIGAMLNSALYLSAVFIAGLTINNEVAWKLSIAAMGFTYLSYLLYMRDLSPEARDRRLRQWASGPDAKPSPFPSHATRIVVITSILLGSSAGIALLF